MTHVRHTFLETLERVRPVLAAEVTSGSWERPSQLPEMTVGAVAAHLLRAVTTVATYLAAPRQDGPPIDPSAYYTTILRNSELRDPVHVGIRERAQRESDRGPAGVVSSWDATVSELARLLLEEPEDRTLKVAGDLVMRLEDYLVTRLIEVVVHTDDLAVSVGLDTPNFDPSAMNLVFDHLIDVARSRHGDLAVLRAFARRERDPAQALRIF